MSASPALGVEHRSHLRYSLKLDVRFRVARSDQVCSGKIVDIGSGGVCFSCAEVLPGGTKVQMAIDWPVLLSDGTGMQLRVTGRVLRQDRRGTAIEILRHEFHTRKTQPDQIAMPQEIRVA
jgi:hypothetical protein